MYNLKLNDSEVKDLEAALWEWLREEFVTTDSRRHRAIANIHSDIKRYRERYVRA